MPYYFWLGIFAFAWLNFKGLHSATKGHWDKHTNWGLFAGLMNLIAMITVFIHVLVSFIGELTCLLSESL